MSSITTDAKSNSCPGGNAGRTWSIIFDLGGVLVQWSPQAILDRLGLEEPDRDRVRREVFEHSDWLQLDRGTLNEATAIGRFCERTGLGASDVTRLMRCVRESLVPIEAAWALVDELKALAVPLYALSNMAVPVFDHLYAREPRLGLFRGIVVSGAIGFIKPEREIFVHTIDRYGLDTTSTIFIDDHLPNVMGARRFGLHAIHFRGAEDCRCALRQWPLGLAG